MPKRLRKPRDFNQLAATIVGEATAQIERKDPDAGRTRLRSRWVEKAD